MKILVTIHGRPVNAIGETHQFEFIADLPPKATRKQIIEEIYKNAEHVANIENVISTLEEKVWN